SGDAQARTRGLAQMFVWHDALRFFPKARVVDVYWIARAHTDVAPSDLRRFFDGTLAGIAREHADAIANVAPDPLPTLAPTPTKSEDAAPSEAIEAPTEEPLLGAIAGPSYIEACGALSTLSRAHGLQGAWDRIFEALGDDVLSRDYRPKSP